MDYADAIKRVYEHIENGHVDKAVMGCLRIATNLKDYLYTAIFLREMYPNKKELIHVLYDDTSHLPKEAQKFLYEKSLEYWLESHTLDYSLATDDNGEERNVFALSVGELDSDIEQSERTIQGMTLPSGMGEFDTAAFTDKEIGGHLIRKSGGNRGTPYNGTKLRELWSKERFVYQRNHRDFQSNGALSQP